MAQGRSYGGYNQGPRGSLFAGIMAGWDGASQIFNDIETLRKAKKIRDQDEAQQAAEKKRDAGAGKPGLAEALLATPDEYGTASVSRTSTDPYYGLGIGQGPVTMTPVGQTTTPTGGTGKPATGDPTKLTPDTPAAPDTATPTTTAQPSTTMPAVVTDFKPGRAAELGGGGDKPAVPGSTTMGAAPTAPPGGAAALPVGPRLATSGSGGGPGDHTTPTPDSASVPRDAADTASKLPTFGTGEQQPQAPQHAALGTPATQGSEPTGMGISLGELSFTPASAGRLGQSLLYGPGGRAGNQSVDYTLGSPEDQQQAISTSTPRKQQAQQQAQQAPRYAQTATQAAAPVLIPQFDVFGNPILQPTNPQQVRRG